MLNSGRRVCAVAAWATALLMTGAGAGAAVAEEVVPASGAFVTLERARGGALKYAGAKADGIFVIKSLAQGRYAMSITPPKRDRHEDFTMAVQATFEGIIVVPGGKVVATGRGRTAKVSKKPGSTIVIPAAVWKQKAIWLNVDIALEDVQGRFEYVLSDTDEVRVMVLGVEE